MSKGFKFEIERPWDYKGSPEFHKVTLDGQEISIHVLADLAEKMRIELLKLGVVVKLEGEA